MMERTQNSEITIQNDAAHRPPFAGVGVMRYAGMEPDAWQTEILEGGHSRLLLNCSRQAGKSTTVAVLALEEAMAVPSTLVLLLSRSLRQSTELFRTLTDIYSRVGQRFLHKLTKYELLLQNRSRIVSLPCQPDTVRGYAGVDLLIIDEAARVPDDLYRAVRPMLAVSKGRLVCLSTPYGKRGFFYDAWAKGGADWHRVEVHAKQIPRIGRDFLRQERRALGRAWFRQEYGCSFEALEGLVYPDFARCVVPALPAHLAGFAPDLRGLRRVGGIDFGFRNPFAAVWGALDRDGVLWLVGEHYSRGQPLSYHSDKLPRDVHWYADPSGAADICELTRAGFTISRGDNALRQGIAAVTARVRKKTLRVLARRCPHLLAEAQLYRYSTDPADRRAETPVDDDNHALAALRYLVSKIDQGKQANRASPSSNAATAAQKRGNPWPAWLQWDNEEVWTRVC